MNCGFNLTNVDPRRSNRSIPFVCCWLAVTAISLLLVQSATAEDGFDLFEKKIRPVLIKHCYECHSASSTEIKGGLRLDSRDFIRKGGETGPAIVPGKADQSILLAAIRHESFEMPPDKKLPDSVVADFEKWIAIGAPDSRDRPPTASEAAELSWQAILDSRRQWWSMQPVTTPDVLNVENPKWSNQPIDRFILHKLKQAGLKPAGTADPTTLLRRLKLVLLGLPPTPEEVQTFLTEYTVNPDLAYANLVDRLLDSPHFGERWARHWMDVVRFTETHGNEWNYEVHHAWRYRDYLIRAFNADLPYNQFVREHIAGDLLPEPRWNDGEQFNESIIGTAFYRFGEVNHDDCIGLTSIGYDLLDNRIDTLTKAFQATTVACARCHDHKMDAVSAKDYYALAGILRSSRLVAHTIDSPNVNALPMRKLGEIKAKIRKSLGQQWQTVAETVGRYLLAADAVRRNAANADELSAGLDSGQIEKWMTALKVENPPLEHPLSPWLKLVGKTETVVDGWQQLKAEYASQQQQRRTFDESNFKTYADFRLGQLGDWQASGQGLRQGPTASGEFQIAIEGDAVVKAILPAGCYTHTLSDKLNGWLQSPILHKSKKYISFQVLGEQTSAVRLVSNNCQLNYKNYHALTSDRLGWVTFSPPDDLDNVRVYAELMTKFDNPKFPDQLGTLGNDNRNDRIPWEEAATNPRSFFGVTRVVVHDCKETPKPELDHLLPLFTGDSSAPPTTLAEVTDRYAGVIRQSITNWANNSATDADVRWLNWLLKNELLSNSLQQSSQIGALVAEYRMVEQQELSQPRLVPGLADFDDGFDQPLLLRGDNTKVGEPVPRRFLEALTPSDESFASTGSGRLQLAERIADESNPLTSRVMVNRVWHHLFGTGIVRSVDDFGHVGELPSHPELLDYLANRFVQNGWSVKRLIREIVRTQTFQSQNRLTIAAAEIDPSNRLLQHYPARRLDAEAIRDSILATSGRLRPKLFGLSVHPYREHSNPDRRLFPGPLDGDGRRSIYTKVSLMEGPKFLEAFNFPGSKITQGRRDVTNAPTQALALLNDPFVTQQAEFWSMQLLNDPGTSMEERLRHMIRQALGRAPNAAEETEFRTLVQELAGLHQVAESDILASQLLWQDVAHVILNLKEFIYIP